ncbi:MAG: PQQ-dependent sugar dehydrogenase [Anaerolineae bacterium]
MANRLKLGYVYLLLALAVIAVGCAPASATPAAVPTPAASSSAAPAARPTSTVAALTTAPSQAAPSANPGAEPGFTIEPVLAGLDHPWDIVWLPDGSFVFSQRGNVLTWVGNGSEHILNAPEDTYAGGEGGLLGLAVDPEFASNHYLYACFDSAVQGKISIRVARWVFDTTAISLTSRVDIITGLPMNPSGRHSGCQPAFGPDGYLWVGTGDTANGAVPQSPTILGGKILRVDRDGNPAPGNLGAPFDPRIYSYGHRNVQGLGFFASARAGGVLGISIEQGTYRDDEVNLLLPGNFGYDPVPGYNESVPMTDKAKYPDAIAAIWSSGDPTLATSGGTVITGKQWGAWDGAVAVAALKAARVVILQLDDNLRVAKETQILTGEYGRLRTVQQAPDGSLYILTDNGGGQDIIFRLVSNS